MLKLHDVLAQAQKNLAESNDKIQQLNEKLESGSHTEVNHESERDLKNQVARLTEELFKKN